MASLTCFSTARSCAARFTRVDDCGVPVTGDSSQIRTKGYVSIAYSPDISEGDEIEVKNACGEICYTDKACDTIKGYDITIEFCQVDPDLFSLVTGQPLDLTASGSSSTGFQITSNVQCTGGFALEAWTEIKGQQCVPGAAGQWVYFLAPLVKGGVIQEFTLANDSITFTVQARAYKGSLWGTGPASYLVDPDAAGVAKVLNTAIGADTFLDIHYTTIQPPTPACGYQAL